MKDKIEFIAFDADDTLWESELYIQEFEHKFCNLLRQYLPASSISQSFLETETKNLHMYGYGLKSIMLSMTETICKVTDGNGSIHLIEEVIGWGQELLQKPVILLGASRGFPRFTPRRSSGCGTTCSAIWRGITDV